MSKRYSRSDLIWSKELCYAYATNSLFDPNIKDLQYQRLVMDRFIDFYCFGSIPNGVKVTTVIIDAASLLSDAENKEQLFWNEEFFGKTTEASQKPEPSKEETKVDADKSSPEPGNAATSAKDAEKKQDGIDISPKPATDLEIFAAECKEMTQTNPASDLQFYTVRRLICFLALTLLTAVVKNEQEILSIYSSARYDEKLYKKVYRYMVKRLHYGPPCKEAISKAIEVKNADDIKSFIAKIVLEVKRASDLHSEVFSFLSGSVLADTANYGIEIIYMVNQICNEYKIWFPMLQIMIQNLPSSFFAQIFRMGNFSFTIMDHVSESLDNIVDYFVKHRIDDRTPTFPDFTFNWAAVISENKVLSKLKVEKNAHLACILEHCFAHSNNDLGIFKRLEAKAKESGDKKALHELSQAKALGDILIKEIALDCARSAAEERRKLRLQRILRGELVSDSDDSS